MRCHLCRKTADQEGEPPACSSGPCPTGYNLLPPLALRLLEVRGLLVQLTDHGLAPRICDEYDLGLHDLRWLAEIEQLIKQLQPEVKPHGGSEADHTGRG